MTYLLPLTHSVSMRLQPDKIFHCVNCFLPFKNKCTQPEDVKLCTLILRPASATPQHKKVVRLITTAASVSEVFLYLHPSPSYNHLSYICFLLKHPSFCQSLVKEAVVHPLEVEPGHFLPQDEQSLAPPPVPLAASHPGRHRISLSISVGPAPVLPSTVTRSALTPRPPTLEDGMRGREGWREPSGGREKWGITKERARGRLSQQKERKATQMLAIVLGKQWEVQTN